jgi:hypothetical protein
VWVFVRGEGVATIRTSKPFPWELMEPAPIGTPGEACAKVVDREMGTVTAPVVASGSCREEGKGRGSVV